MKNASAYALNKGYLPKCTLGNVCSEVGKIFEELKSLSRRILGAAASSKSALHFEGKKCRRWEFLRISWELRRKRPFCELWKCLLQATE